MIERAVALIVDESKWMTFSMLLAFGSVAIVLLRTRGQTPSRSRIMASLSLLFGVTIGTMAFGHLLAVTTKLVQGTLEGPILTFYVIGLVLALPSAALIVESCRGLHAGSRPARAIGLNLWLGLSLLAVGPFNLPLAFPALLNTVYARHSRPFVGWSAVVLAAGWAAVLFAGSLVFFASGQSFEQFRGIE